jgi:tetratricopeptide (TPR) repeat protein
VVPVGLRNYALSGDFLISTSQFGPNFYIGNHTGATGVYEPLLPGHGNAQNERDDATALATQAVGHPLSPGEVSTYWFRRTLAEIRQAPLAWARLMGRKLLLALNSGEMADTDSMREETAYSIVLRSTGWFSFGVLLALAVAGLWITRARQFGVLYAAVAGLMLSVALFYVFSRYRYPVVPILALFAAAALAALAVRPFAWRRWRVAAGLAVTTLVVGALPLVGGENVLHVNVALELSRLGRKAEAIPWLERAVQEVPSDIEAQVQLAIVRLDTGDVSRALADLTATARTNAGYGPAHAALARALTLAGRPDDALRELETVVVLEPRSAGARLNYGIALWNAGRRGAAVDQYRAAVKLRPEDPVGYNDLALALHQMGQVDEAVACYETAIRLEPKYAEAHSNLAMAIADRGQLEQALGHLRTAEQLQPGNYGIHMNLADLLLRAGRATQAIEQAEKAMAGVPDTPQAMAPVLLRLGQAYISAGRIDEGVGALRRAVDLANGAGEPSVAAEARQLLHSLGR